MDLARLVADRVEALAAKLQQNLGEIGARRRIEGRRDFDDAALGGKAVQADVGPDLAAQL
ncbi:MAG TPA: hypothetical protein VFS43_10090 [Polyangiaceae bacterium]|nr:hypothetical protein [Polyangiaceae bacterium]